MGSPDISFPSFSIALCPSLHATHSLSLLPLQISSLPPSHFLHSCPLPVPPSPSRSASPSEFTRYLVREAGSNTPRIMSNRRLINPKCKHDTVLCRYYRVLPTGTLSRTMDKGEGLSSLRGEQWINDKYMTELPWQYGPGSPLDYGSQFITVESFPLTEKSSEIELEWQWIMNQQQTPKAESFPLNKTRECTEDTLDGSLDNDTKEDTAGVQNESSTASSLLTSSNGDGSSDAETSKSSKISGNLSAELEAVKSSVKNVEEPYHTADIEWHRAEGKELATLVSRKGQFYLENCDLPPSQNSVTWKGSVTNSDFPPSIPIKPYSHQTTTDKISLPSSDITSTTVTLSMSAPVNDNYPPPISASSTVTASSSLNSESSRKISQMRSKQGFETLGEALCHSQTRARQGEKLAAQALQEKDKLSRLFFRETLTTRTYRHWVQTLELENKLLKTSSLNHCVNENKSGLQNVSEQRTSNSWKHVRKRPSYRKKYDGSKGQPRSWSAENNALVRCTIGIAFALGLSFAGAGIMIGWSMGWILLSN